MRVATQFFQAHLPATLLEQIDLSTLKLEKHSFIDEHFKASEADVIYRVQMGQQTGYLYTVCEQQTEVDTRMAFRLWRYAVRLMELHIRQHPDGPLPPVYTLVVYSGQEPWTAPLEIFPLFGNQEGWARDWLFKPYQLIDLQRLDDEDLQKHLGSGLLEFALKYRTIRNLASFLETLLPWVDQLEKKWSQAGIFLGHVVLEYVLDGVNSHANEIEVFIEKVNRYLTGKLRGEVMTLAQQFEQRGVQQGMQQGIQQGMQQGMQQGEAALLLRQIESRFGIVPFSYIQRIKSANSETLLAWGSNILTAKTLDDVFVKEEQ
ncbi:MAG: transposase [Gammaproteobacteria bacterium]|nr:transposase [Gammaproteobacteria bacterium]